MKSPEFMIRVKLPNPGGYASCPSGDTDYEDVYDKAIKDAMPDGFELKPIRLNEKYAIDSEKRSIIPIQPMKHTVGEVSPLYLLLNTTLEENKKLQEKLVKIVELVGK